MNIVEKTLSEEKYELSKPLSIPASEGGGEPNVLTELSLPFSKLRGRDVVEAQEEYETLRGGTLEIFENSKDFQAFMIAKMAKVPYKSIVDDLAVADFSVLTLTMYRFLLRGA